MVIKKDNYQFIQFLGVLDMGFVWILCGIFSDFFQVLVSIPG